MTCHEASPCSTSATRKRMHTGYQKQLKKQLFMATPMKMLLEDKGLLFFRCSMDISRFLDNLVSALQKSASENISKMPPLNNLPHMEPHLRALYHETYYVTLVGLHNVSIVMQGVLLEALVKEIIYDKEEVEFQQPFGSAINRCKSNEYLDNNEIEFLEGFKDAIRNIYQHVDIKKLTQGIPVAGWFIKIDENDVPGSILKGIEAIREGRAAPPTPITIEDLRPVGYIVKETIDKRQSLPLFQQVDKFVRDILSKYLPPK